MSSDTDNSEASSSLSMESPLFCNLDAHRSMLQAIIDHSPADIYLKDLDGKYLLVNKNFGERVKMDPAQVIGKTAQDLFPKTEADQLTANDAAVLNAGQANQFEEPLSLDDGTHTLLSEKFPLRDEDGQIYAVCGISTDITSRKAYEKKLRNLNSQVQQQGRTLETVLSASPSIVYMFDSQGRFLYANQSGAANFGVRPVDIIGKTWKALKLPDGVFEPFMEQVTRAFKTGKTIKDDLSYPTPDGGQDFAYTLIPIMDIRGRVVNVIAYVNDVTLDREKDRVLKQQTRDLHRSNLELEQFAKIASHDLNEPLRMVQSYLKLLNESLGEDLTEEAKKILDYARDGAGRMKLLINDLLEYSRVGVGKEPSQNVKMNDLVTLVERDLKMCIHESDATITVGDLPAVWGNAIQLRQLFQNLVSNGIKYNKEPNPIIEISVDQRNDMWVFEVKDNGIGIEAKDFDKIFHIFQRLHGRAEYSGTGIGLAICRKITLQHDGDIWVNSEPGEGSSFFFSLPIRYKGGHQMMIDLFDERE
ncbi:MAG: PAS domain-containing protein [Verrucomicrobia bacterium]|nr:PAS domain-containing protein [Verrucomicrobiota bacterium]